MLEWSVWYVEQTEVDNIAIKNIYTFPICVATLMFCTLKTRTELKNRYCTFNTHIEAQWDLWKVLFAGTNQSGRRELRHNLAVWSRSRDRSCRSWSQPPLLLQHGFPICLKTLLTTQALILRLSISAYAVRHTALSKCMSNIEAVFFK